MPDPIAPPLSTPAVAPVAPTNIALPTEPDASVPPPDASSLEKEQVVQHDTDAGAADRANGFEAMQRRRAEAQTAANRPAPPVTPPAPEPPKPTEQTTPPKPEPPKPDAVTPPPKPEPPKPDEQPKPGEPPKPATGDDEPLPDDILEGLPENEPNHRKAQSQSATMRRRLKKLDTIRKAQEAELVKLRAGGPGTAPADYEEVKKKATQLETEKAEADKQLAETRDRLYATELRHRPEYQEQVHKPWQRVQDTIAEIVGQYPNLRLDDVYGALHLIKPGMNPEELKDATRRKKAILDEMMSQMTSETDKQDFNTAIREIPKIAERQRQLDANSKEKLESFRAEDKKKAEEKTAQETGRAITALGQHRETRKKLAPGLFHMDGDTPEAKTYNDGIAALNQQAEEIIKSGFDGIRPEVKAMMVQDALVSDHVLRNISVVLQKHVDRAKQLETEKKELETANATLQSELDEYKGDTPGGGGHHPGGTAATGVPGADATAGDRASRVFTHLR